MEITGARFTFKRPFGSDQAYWETEFEWAGEVYCWVWDNLDREYEVDWLDENHELLVSIDWAAKKVFIRRPINRQLPKWF